MVVPELESQAWSGKPLKAQEGGGALLLEGAAGLSRELGGLLAWKRLPDARASAPSHPAHGLEGDGRTCAVRATF